MRIVDTFVSQAGLANALLLSALILPSSAFAQKIPDMRVSADASGATSALSPQVTAVGDTVYLTWRDDRSGAFDIYFNRSLDGGATWQGSDSRLDSTIPGRADSGAPQLVEANGSIYVAWQDDRNDPGLGGVRHDIYVNCSADGGAHWLPSDFRLNTDLPGDAASINPRLAATADFVYAVWRDDRDHAVNLYFNRSLDGGANWLASDLRVNRDLSLALRDFPQIAASGDSVYVTWQDHRNSPPNGPADIYINCSPDGGVHWLAADFRLNTDLPGTGNASLPQIAVSGDSVYVTWQDERVPGNPDIYFNRSLDGGVTWLSSDIRLNSSLPEASSALAPLIAASGDSVYVTWVDTRNGLEDIYLNRSLDGGTSWLPSDTRLDTNPAGAAESARPAISISGSSAYVTWWDDRDGPLGGIYFNRSVDEGSTWLASDVRLDTEPPVVVPPELHGSVPPQIAVSGDSVYVAWPDQRNGGGEIYFNIPFGSQPYGMGTAGSGNLTPRLDGTDSLTLGSTFTLTISNGLGGAVGLVALAGPDSKGAIPLVGGLLLIDRVEMLVPIILGGASGVPGAGSVSIEIGLPPFPGFNTNFQAALVDPGTGFGFTLTNAVEAWIL